jgi:benzodiazapine receptor
VKQSRKSKRRWVPLVLFVGSCLLVGGLGGYVTAPAIEGWYAGIQKPAWTPPDAVFGPVWSALYICMGVAGWLVWRGPVRPARSRALAIWGAQLLLNFIWTPLFFGLRSPALASADILLLWALIGAFILSARRLSPPAVVLFLPYWIWVSYATALTVAIWRLN